MSEDILSELLEDASPDSLPRKMAEQAAELYRLSMAVCERFAFLHTCIRVAIWSAGSDSGRQRKRMGAGLVWTGQAWSMLAHTALPSGPFGPWGLAWLELPQRPVLIQSRKEPGLDVYKVELFRWCMKNPGYRFRESLFTVWRFKRYQHTTSPTFWYTSEAGDCCCYCNERVSEDTPVLITREQALFCERCTEEHAEGINAKLGKFTIVPKGAR